MRRRGVGISGIDRRKDASKRMQATGSTMAGKDMAHMESQMDVFKTNLEGFARKHRAKINADPIFRREFQKMTATIGVDPLASNKGFWAEMLGVGDFYYALAVQIVDVCLATRPMNGGLISVADLHARLGALRGKDADAISDDDLKRAIGKLGVLGGGYKWVYVGSPPRPMIKSVSAELNTDASELVGLATSKGYIVKPELKWTPERADAAIDSLLKEGMMWVDLQAEPPRYYVPGASL